MKSGFLKVCAVSPRVTVAGVQSNLNAALQEIEKANKNKVQILVFPELFLSGYTCGDLFLQTALQDACKSALTAVCRATENSALVVVIGLPLKFGASLYNCAAVVQNGMVVAVIPKTYIPNYNEYYEKRWFASGDGVNGTIKLNGQEVPFGQTLVRLSDDAVIGVEICEDLWTPSTPGTSLALSGANIIVNLSASNEVVTKNDYRKNLIRMQSAKDFCAYIYASAGVGESTTDLVFSGACTAAENGALLSEGERFAFNGSMAEACIDIEKLNAERAHNTSFTDAAKKLKEKLSEVSTPVEVSDLEYNEVNRSFDPHPFVPSDSAEKDERCREILSIQSHALAKRMSHIGAKKAIIGISGGLDSTLALLVTARALKILNLPNENMICVTMPGFGTTDRTYQNAVDLIHAFGATFMEISIRNAARGHMADIGHDESVHDITYENTQARERTQILMDLANKHGAVLVGTGDLSELALGWCTYNADHMSMYGVNAGVPKTLVRHLVRNEAQQLPEEISKILNDILDTPVSPELLPPDENGNIQQKTEETLGPYEVHDFYLYHFLRFGTRPEKLLFMASRAFAGIYSEEQLKNWLKLFVRRFFTNQFKRSCLPDGPKVGSVSLSPRGDWRMPSDADCSVWLDF
ncbi:MAG TPA: NAD(+) synthase [Candidatus Fimenecus excrementavium]|nr:NAD(+) synthase [Candidatus Fimenecus excrementavium]